MPQGTNWGPAAPRAETELLPPIADLPRSGEKEGANEARLWRDRGDVTRLPVSGVFQRCLCDYLSSRGTLV